MTFFAVSLEWQCHNWKVSNFSRVNSVPMFYYPSFKTYTSLNVSSATVGGRIPSKEHKSYKLRRFFFFFFVSASQILEKAFGPNWPHPVPGSFNSTHDGQSCTRGNV